MKQYSLASPGQSISPLSSPRTSFDNDLPFPAPLPRSDFLAPDFSPSAYLSELAPRRHQALEDLRSDLRQRSQKLSAELLDLVNAHYVDFLDLGSSLRGGNEKVQELRVGLMGYQRDVEATRNVLVEREAEIQGLIDQRKMVRDRLQFGRTLLDWAARIDTLQDQLSIEPVNSAQVKSSGGRNRGIAEGNKAEDEDTDKNDTEDSEDGYELDGEAGSGRTSLITLTRLRIDDFRLIEQIATKLGSEQPFIKTQQHRLVQIRNTLLVDIANCLKQTDRDAAYNLRVLAMYRDLDACNDAVTVLRRRKSIKMNNRSH